MIKILNSKLIYYLALVIAAAYVGTLLFSAPPALSAPDNPTMNATIQTATLQLSNGNLVAIQKDTYKVVAKNSDASINILGGGQTFQFLTMDSINKLKQIPSFIITDPNNIFSSSTPPAGSVFIISGMVQYQTLATQSFLVPSSTPSPSSFTKNNNESLQIGNSITYTKSSAPSSQKIKIAFLPATFATAAYQKDAAKHYVKFYGFYAKYINTPPGVNVTTDLANLTSIVTIKDHQEYIKAFANQIRTILPDVAVSEIYDTDVEKGGLFLADGSNAFNMIILLHEEYVTPEMYYDFKRFVTNGGTLLFIDGNVFYVEVKYDNSTNSITLVKGHSWEFDGKVARRGVYERWINETREWVGSNYWESPINHPVIFANNPFNYTHWEENYVNNPSDVIIFDYKVINPKDPAVQLPTIATYELHYGKGKVIMLGLGAETLYKNEEFLKFFGNLVLLGIQGDCQLAKPNADLHGLDLTGCNFKGVDLSGANLSSANLSGANLEGANLSNAIAIGITPTTLSGCINNPICTR
jgi:hypothetical protein